MLSKLDNATAGVYRQQYTTDANNNTKSVYTDTGNSYIGHLKAQSIEKTTDINMFGKVFKFTTDHDADIQESDRLIIKGIDYDVKGVSKFVGQTFSTTQVLIYKSN